MNKEGNIQELKWQMQQQNILVECIYALHARQDINVAIEEMLSMVGQYYRAERAYIIQFDAERRWMDNTYEWCKDGAESMKDRQQHMEVSAVDRWFPWFENTENFIKSFMHETLGKASGESQSEKIHDVSNFMAVPLFYEGSLMGVLGVDDPDVDRKSFVLLRSVARFVVHDLFTREEYQLLQDEINGYK